MYLRELIMLTKSKQRYLESEKWMLAKDIQLYIETPNTSQWSILSTYILLIKEVLTASKI